MLEESFAHGYIVVDDNFAIEWQNRIEMSLLFDRLILVKPNQFQVYLLVNTGWYVYRFSKGAINDGQEMRRTKVSDLRVIDRVKRAVVRARL